MALKVNVGDPLKFTARVVCSLYLFVAPRPYIYICVCVCVCVLIFVVQCLEILRSTEVHTSMLVRCLGYLRNQML